MGNMRSFEFARKMENKKPVVVDGKEVQAYPEAQLPEYQTAYAAGADFFCAEEVVIPSIWSQVVKVMRDMGVESDNCGYRNIEEGSEWHRIKPTLVHTGIKSNMRNYEGLFLYNRSSNPKKLGLVLANGVGVVDADYFENEDNDGEIMFAFYNFLPWSVTLKVGDRIGQGIFQEYRRPEKGLRVKNVERTSGFGSTGQ